MSTSNDWLVNAYRNRTANTQANTAKPSDTYEATDYRYSEIAEWSMGNRDAWK